MRIQIEPPKIATWVRKLTSQQYKLDSDWILLQYVVLVFEIAASSKPAFYLPSVFEYSEWQVFMVVITCMSIVSRFPPKLRTMCHCLGQVIGFRFPQDMITATGTVIFLRFYNPVLGNCHTSWSCDHVMWPRPDMEYCRPCMLLYSSIIHNSLWSRIVLTSRVFRDHEECHYLFETSTFMTNFLCIFETSTYYTNL